MDNRGKLKTTYEVMCKICGDEFSSMGLHTHLYDTHKIDVIDYVNQYGEYRKKWLNYKLRAEKNKLVCKVCNQFFASKVHLGHHIHKVHDLSGKDYAVQYVFDGIHPTCKCGCGGEVILLKCAPYKRDYLFGHWPTPDLKKHITPAIRKVMSQKAIRRMKHIQRSEISGRIRSSKSATMFLDEVEKKYGVRIEREFRLSNRFFDGRVGRILLEVDGKYWHEKSRQRRIDIVKDTLAAKNGFTIHRFIVSREGEVQKKITEYDGQLRVLAHRKPIR